MGFFNKLFGGGKKDLNFTPSAELMQENIFWDIIQTSFNEAGGETHHQEKELAAGVAYYLSICLNNKYSFTLPYKQGYGVKQMYPALR